MQKPKNIQSLHQINCNPYSLKDENGPDEQIALEGRLLLVVDRVVVAGVLVVQPSGAREGRILQGRNEQRQGEEYPHAEEAPVVLPRPPDGHRPVEADERHDAQDGVPRDEAGGGPAP